MNLTPITQFLERRIGLDTAVVGEELVAHMVAARMTATGLAVAADYLACLAADPLEQQALCEALTVQESWFFRDEAPFRFLQELAVDPAAPWSGRRLRILSCPCSRGEEPYSIVISLLAAGVVPEQLAVTAADVSGTALAAARHGVYGAGAFRGAWAEELRRRYLLPVPGGRYEVPPSVRAAVSFFRGNLVDPDFAAGAAPYDMVFCRNLLIYLTAGARQQAWATLDRLLAPGGWLFVGHAEVMPAVTARFVPGPVSAAFACRKPLASRPGGAAGLPLAVTAGRLRPCPPARPFPAPVALAVPACGEAAATRPAAAPVIAAAVTVDEAAAVRCLADQGDLAAAVCRCGQWLRRQPASAEAHYLMGTLCAAQNDPLAAETNLKRALYLDSGHGDAMLHLALVLERRGDLTGAARLRRRLRRHDLGQEHTAL
jgi:chemotaxis protein methyltransferase WspC